MLIKQSETTAARRTIYFTAVNTADDSAYTSTLSGADIMISKAGGAEAASTGTATHIATGLFKYEFAVGEIDTLGEVSLRLAKTGVYNDVRVVNVVPFDPYSSTSLGLSNLNATVSSRLATADYQDVDDLLDAADTIETGVTLRKAIRYIVAYAVGNVTGGGSGTETFSAAGNPATTRFTSTPTSAGSRTVTLSGG